jgi:hypothetical protein
MRTLLMLLVLMPTAPILGDAPVDRDHITIDLKRQWHFSGFSPGEIKVADNYSMSLSGEYPKFTCNDPGARATWQYNFDLPIEMTTFPTFTLKYRARNIDTKNTLTCIWINEGKAGKGAAIFPLIDFEKLTVDGQTHEIQIDLPTAPSNSQGTPFESGPINGLLVSVMNTDAGEGSLELVDATFSSASEKPHAPEQDQPIALKVLDEQQQPLTNVTVTVDAERKLSARSETSNAEGIATVTPVKNELDRHSLHVEVSGRVPVEVRVDQPPAAPMELVLPKSMQVGGFVQDEHGKPIRLVTVRVFSQLAIANRDRNIRIASSATVKTDEKGQWLSPPLPESDHVFLRLNHPDYTTDTNFAETLAPLDELRSGIATIVLKK